MLRMVLALLLFVPSTAGALCLENCQAEAERNYSFSDAGSAYAPRPNSSGGRNIRAGDVKNSVFGDMNIRVGHERLDIRTESASNNNTIDATINSTIVLGDMNR